MRSLKGAVLEEIASELKKRKINLSSENRVCLIFVRNEPYFSKFNQLQECTRVNGALALQDAASNSGFPCNLPLKNSLGSFTEAYKDGFITSYEYIPGEQLESERLYCKEVMFFVEKFFEFQKSYCGPKITYCRKGLGELMDSPIFSSVTLSDDHRKYLEYLSMFEEQICRGDSIIHGDILPKNIIHSPKGQLILIDFERVRRGAVVEEIASSVVYSAMSSGLSLKKVYECFSHSIPDKLEIDLIALRRTIAQKSAEYLLHRKINFRLGKSKKREGDKAEKFFLGAIELLGGMSF